jgi:hypothetical protein
MKVWGFRAICCAFPLMLVLGFAVTATADNTDMRIVFDQPGNTDATVTTLYAANQVVSVSWQSCTNTGIPSQFSTYTACLALNNLTGSAITSLNLSFTTPAVFATQSFDCSAPDGFLTSNNCPTGEVGADTFVSITFSGGSSIPSSTDFFIAADATCTYGACLLSDFPQVGVTADPAPEPGSFTLVLPLLVLLLGAAWFRRGSSAVGAG